MGKILVTRSSMPELDEYVDKIRSIWDSHWMTNMGQYHNELQSQLEQYLGVDNISLFSNGHMALELALQALNLKGEVITTPFTFASTTHAIVRNGLKPIFCDIDEDTYTIDTDKIEELITDSTCAILPVHVYGNVCNVVEINRIAQKYDLKVIYDAAHAFGVEYQQKAIGTYGDASMFSFHATKVFNTIEGGAVCYRDEEFGHQLYKLKNFGIKSEDVVDGIGANAKMNEFQAAMGLCNIKHINDEINKRRVIVENYRKRLSHVDGIKLMKQQADVKANYAYFPIVVDEREFGFSRNEIYNELQSNEIYTRKYFYPLTNSFDCYKSLYNVEDTPIAQKISLRVLTLPLYADLSIDSVNRVCDIILGMKK